MIHWELIKLEIEQIIQRHDTFLGALYASHQLKKHRKRTLSKSLTGQEHIKDVSVHLPVNNAGQRRVLSPFVAIVISINAASAQGNKMNEYKYTNYFDLAVSVSAEQFSAAVAWSHLHGIGKKKKIQIGYGVRLTSFFAGNKYYITAPSKFTSTAQNLGTIFSKTITENIDTITTATSLTNSLNLGIYLQYNISQKIDVGFNIDAIGFSFGPKKEFDVISSTFDPNQSPVQRAAPTRFNLLLTSDNDIGSLNSEFYLRYWITKKIGIRAGYTFLFSEYRTENTLSFDNGRIMNDRYRYKANMALLAVSYNLFGKN